MLKSTTKGSFLIQILDQQHSSWQGTITWIRNSERKTFRSALELIKFIDGSLEDNSESLENISESLENNSEKENTNATYAAYATKEN